MGDKVKQEWTITLRGGEQRKTVKIKAVDQLEAMRQAREQLGPDYLIEDIFVANWKSV